MLLCKEYIGVSLHASANCPYISGLGRYYSQVFHIRQKFVEICRESTPKPVAVQIQKRFLLTPCEVTVTNPLVVTRCQHPHLTTSKTASRWSCIYLLRCHWREIVTSCVAGNRRGRPDFGMETSAQNIQGVWYRVGFVCENGVCKLHTHDRSDQHQEPGISHVHNLVCRTLCPAWAMLSLQLWPAPWP